MNETLPHFLNLDGLVINVDKILYIRKSEANNTDSYIGFVAHKYELHIKDITPNQFFNLLDDYDKHLREVKHKV